MSTPVYYQTPTNPLFDQAYVNATANMIATIIGSYEVRF